MRQLVLNFAPEIGLTWLEGGGNLAGEARLLALSCRSCVARSADLPWDEITIAVLGCLAAFFLYKLYAVLGRRTGEPPQPVTPHGVTPDARMAFAQGGVRAQGVGEGVMAILRADPSFDIDHFMAGAR